MASGGQARKNGNGTNIGFEAELFQAADKLRGNLEPSEYKHVALGLIFLKYISESVKNWGQSGKIVSGSASCGRRIPATGRAHPSNPLHFCPRNLTLSILPGCSLPAG